MLGYSPRDLRPHLPEPPLPGRLIVAKINSSKKGSISVSLTLRVKSQTSPLTAKNLLTPHPTCLQLILMKNVLSLLLSFVFIQTQSWALTGGPFGSSGAQASVIGTYAGVLVPTNLGSNSLGLFNIGVPETGFASGSFAIFASGGTFYGTMYGVLDPNTRELSAVAEGQQNAKRTIVDPLTGAVTISFRPVALASGQITAKLQEVRDKQRSKSLTLTGTGSLDTFDIDNSGLTAGNLTQTGRIEFIVNGFQQSVNVTGLVDIAQITGAQPLSTTAP